MQFIIKGSYFTRMIAILAVLAIIDVVIGVLGDTIILKLNNKIYDGDIALLNYSLNKVEPDILIVGSSTAQSDYDPDIFEDRLSCNSKKLFCFNAGASTQGLPYDYALIRSVIGRNKPKHIILDIIPLQLYQGFSEEQQSRIRPFVGVNQYVKEAFIHNTSYREILLLHSNMYRLNTEFFKLALSFMKNTGSNGFYRHEGSLKKIPNFVKEAIPSELNKMAFCELKRIVSLCKDNGVLLTIVVSPCLNHRYSNDEAESFLKTYCASERICFINYKDNRFFQKCNFFHDQRHMNVNGARLFSSAVAKKINEFYF